PAPDLFLHAAAEMGAEPKDCLVVEDSDLGIVAARAAGMLAWQFAGGSHFAASHKRGPGCVRPDRLFDRMADFFEGASHLRR
ncbi:MAG: HAD-IA family hydrolase, partial [Dongiaceae bacterium]